MKYEVITLSEERNVTLAAMLQGVSGEFRGIEARPTRLFHRRPLYPGAGNRLPPPRRKLGE